MAGLTQLRQLTTLILDGLWSNISEQVLQLLKKPLPLRHLRLHAVHPCGAVHLQSLAHLTQLTKFDARYVATEGVTLPAQLQRLCVADYTNIAPVLALQQLQHLTIAPYFDKVEKQTRVVELAQLPALQMLTLEYHQLEDAAAASPTWVLLPQLRALFVTYYFPWQPELPAPYRQQMAAIMAGAAAATHLTSLQIHHAGWGYMRHETGPIPVCASLAGLTGLRVLELNRGCLGLGDALAFDGTHAADLV